MAREIPGAAAMLSKLKKIATNAPDEFKRALYQEAELIVKECKQRVPVDTGNLRATIRQEGPTREGRRILTEIVAGSSSEDYALIVHEDLEAHHDDGEAKYIERPIKETSGTLMGRIAKRIDLNRTL